LARQGAEVVGLDFSQPMLDIAIERSTIENLSSEIPNSPLTTRHSPLFVCGDAERLPFDDAQFQIVTVGYGLRNLASWETGLHEMKRVAAPGGRLLALDFGKPKVAAWR